MTRIVLKGGPWKGGTVSECWVAFGVVEVPGTGSRVDFYEDTGTITEDGEFIFMWSHFEGEAEAIRKPTEWLRYC